MVIANIRRQKAQQVLDVVKGSHSDEKTLSLLEDMLFEKDPQITTNAFFNEEDETISTAVDLGLWKLKATVSLPETDCQDSDVVVEFGLKNLSVGFTTEKVSNPQVIKVTGHLKGEIIVFSVHAGYFLITALVNIPQEDRNTSKVYWKFGVDKEGFNKRQEFYHNNNERAGATATANS